MFFKTFLRLHSYFSLRFKKHPDSSLEGFLKTKLLYNLLCHLLTPSHYFVYIKQSLLYQFCLQLKEFNQLWSCLLLWKILCHYKCLTTSKSIPQNHDLKEIYPYIRAGTFKPTCIIDIFKYWHNDIVILGNDILTYRQKLIFCHTYIRIY